MSHAKGTKGEELFALQVGGRFVSWTLYRVFTRIESETRKEREVRHRRVVLSFLIYRSRHLILLQPNGGIILHEIEVHLVPQQLPDIIDLVLYHRRPLQAQTEAAHPQVLGHAHGRQHLRPKHAAIPDLDPLLQAHVKAKDLERGLGVRVIGRLEAQAMNPHFRVKDLHEADEVAEREAEVCDHALDLVELGQVGGVDALVAEDAVDGEVARRTRVGGEAVQHVYRGGGRVGAEDEPEGFLLAPGVAVADGAEGAGLVDRVDVGPVFFVVEDRVAVLGVWVRAGLVGLGGVGDEEGVLHVASWVLLRDEEGVEVPEASFDESGRC